jgi:hypothetical protein
MIIVQNMAQVSAAIDRAVQQYAEQIVRASMAATWDTAVDVLDDAKGETPVITGNLRSSAKVQGPVREGMSAASDVGYTADYAAYVHEDMQGRQPKFLEKAVMAVGPRLRGYTLKELQ